MGVIDFAAGNQTGAQAAALARMLLDVAHFRLFFLLLWGESLSALG
jgi:hypothetical protein